GGRAACRGRGGSAGTGSRGPPQPGLHPARGGEAALGSRGREPRGDRPGRSAERRRGQGGVSVEPGKGIRTPGIEGSASRRGATEPELDGAEVVIHDARPVGADDDFDRSLRPPRLEDFVNQVQVTEQLGIFIEAARRGGEALDHVLLAGPPGLGKTSLAYIIAAELSVPMVQTAGPALERKADIAAFLTALEPGSVFFIAQIH